MADGQVAVGWENHQEEGAGHLVDGGGDHVEGAGQAAEHPVLLDHRDHQQRNS